MNSALRSIESLVVISVLTGDLIAATGCGGSGTTANPSSDVRANLEVLGYLETLPVEGDQAEAPVRVTRHDALRAMSGLNLLTPRHLAQAELLGMGGEPVHQWHLSGGAPWQHVELCPDGDLLAFVKDHELLRLAPDSTLRWRVKGRFHHDVTPAPDGGFWAVMRRVDVVELHGHTVPILSDLMTWFTDDGNPVEEISLLDVFGSWVTAHQVDSINRWSDDHGILQRLTQPRADEASVVPPDTPPDVFHLNSIEIVDCSIPGVCLPGDLLISVRNLNLVAVVDPKTSGVRWTWGPGELERQHHAILLANGHILIFDNGVSRRASRVVEVDPADGRIVWQYRGTDRDPFFSISRGSAQRLPNGNTLICETDAGRAFEVTSDGDIVWELRTPFLNELNDNGKPQRAAYYRVIRFTDPNSPALTALGVGPAGT